MNNIFLTDFLLDPKIIFLNHGSFGATPKYVFETYQKWQYEMERQPVEFLGRRASDLLFASRQKLAAYLGTAPDNLVYVTNATTAINTVARSLNLEPGDEVLTSNHEYGAMDRTWRFLAQRHGFSYITHHLSLPFTSDADWVDEFWQSVTPRTKVIYLSHITSPTALIFPIQRICQLARNSGILTVIDGAHTPGQLDLNLDDLGADFYTGNLHKWLCAPKGAAFLYARPDKQYLIQPLVVSWGYESENPGTSRFIDYMEWQGTRDISSFLAVPAAIEYQQQHNWELIRKSCHQMAVKTSSKMAELTGLQPLFIDDHWFAQMASSPLPSEIDIALLKSYLYDNYRIEIPVMKWGNLNLIRYSFQAYNSTEDIDILLTALTNALPLCKNR